MSKTVLMDPNDDLLVGFDESIAPSETTEGSASNARKRKKSSRACDFCHINHQPCDNAKPRCSYCERHGKNCLYLRPQKKRGPAQGYRSALHSMRESAAAWGAALNLIPSLGPVIEGYLQKEEGKRLIRAIKDPQQQEFFIQSWQQSSVYRTFFGDELTLDGDGGDAQFAPGGPALTSEVSGAVNSSQSAAQLVYPAPLLPPPPPSIPTTDAGGGGTNLGLHPMQMPLSLPPTQSTLPPQAPSSSSPSLQPPMAPTPFPSHASHQPPLAYDPKLESLFHQHPSDLSNQQGQAHVHGMAGLDMPHMSLTDIVARDAARSSNSFSQTLGSLGFAPDETLNDFLAMSYNPDPLDSTIDNDPLLGSDLDQKAYYELLMGRQFS